MDWRKPTHRDAFPTIGLERSRCILNPTSSSIMHEQSVPGRSRFHHPVETWRATSPTYPLTIHTETLHATSLRTRDVSNEASAPLRALPGYQSRDATCCVGDSMGLRIKSARTQAHFDTPAMVFLLLALRRIVSLRGGGVKVRSKVVR